MTFTLFIIFLIVALVLVVALAIFISAGNSKKRKFIVWGVSMMLVIGPLLSFIIGIIYSYSADNRFGGMALSGIVYVIIFVIGLTTLLIGFLGLKEDNKQISTIGHDS